jgi:hypothetical protein
LIPDAGAIRRRSAALAIIRRHITATEASRTNRKRTSAGLITVIIPADVNIQRNICRPAARHSVRDRLPVNRIVISIGPIKAEIGGHVGVRHAMPEKPEQKPNPENLDDAPTDFRQFPRVWYFAVPHGLTSRTIGSTSSAPKIHNSV